MARKSGDVFHVQHRTEPHALLDAEREVVNTRTLAVPVEADYGIRRKETSAVQESIQVAVIISRRVIDRRLSGLRFIAEDLVCDSKAAAHGSLRVPEDIPGKSDARL